MLSRGRGVHAIARSPLRMPKRAHVGQTELPSRAAAVVIADAALCLAGGEGGRLVGVAFGRCAGGGRDGD